MDPKINMNCHRSKSPKIDPGIYMGPESDYDKASPGEASNTACSQNEASNLDCLSHNMRRSRVVAIAVATSVLSFGLLCLALFLVLPQETEDPNKVASTPSSINQNVPTDAASNSKITIAGEDILCLM